MGLNFYDYDGLQPKITPPKHFSRQCIKKLETYFALFTFLDFRTVVQCVEAIKMTKKIHIKWMAKTEWEQN